MSEVVLIAALGPAARNTGSIRYVDVLAELYDNSVWRFRVVGAGMGARDGGAEAEMTLSSRGAYADEIAAGFAIAIDHGGARKRFRETGPDAGPDDVAELAAMVAEIDVAIVVTGLGATEVLAVESFSPAWSVVSAWPVSDARRSQWDDAVIVADGGER